MFFFVPVVLGLSESAGVQSAAIVVRNLTMGHTGFRNLSKVFTGEAMVGLCIGTICGTIVGLVASYWKLSRLTGLAIGASLALTISLSALIGLLLPLIFKRVKIDPAIASGPLVLAICDLQTLILYFNLSGVILRS